MSSDFSFHCMICFEEFHPEERYPVVLPCGHTYVCNICANRLDKCMECRIPLYTIVRPSSHRGDGGIGGAGGGVGTEGRSLAPLVVSPIPPATPMSTGRGASRTPSWAQPQNPASVTDNLPGSVSPHLYYHNQIIKKRLPLPKNIVLLSLIEATELVTPDVNRKYGSDEDGSEDEGDVEGLDGFCDGGDTNDNNGGDKLNGENSNNSNSTAAVNLTARPSVFSMNSMIDAEDDEEEKIRFGTSLAVGVAGTYAVATRDGLTIVPTRPSNTSKRSDSPSNVCQPAEEDVDLLLEKNLQAEAKNDKDSPSLKRSNSNDKDWGKLSFGDRVQVVSIEGGWAKLARGYGYVHVDKHSLVKVGGAVDHACKIEAMLRNLSQRRKELRHEQSKIDHQSVRLMNELQSSLQNHEDLTVIAADVFSEPKEAGENSVELVALEKKEEDVSAHPTTPVRPRSLREQRNDYDAAMIKPSPRLTQRSVTVVPEQASRPSFVCFAGDVFSGYATTTNPRPMTPSSPSSLDGALALFTSASSQPSPGALRAGAQAWRERHGRLANQGIDFRTGMSGHMALMSTHPHPHEYLESANSYSSFAGTGGTGGGVNGLTSVGGGSYHFPKMSSHTGLTMSKSKIRGLLSNLTLPSFGMANQMPHADGMGSVRGDTDTREGVLRTGSM